MWSIAPISKIHTSDVWLKRTTWLPFDESIGVVRSREEERTVIAWLLECAGMESFRDWPWMRDNSFCYWSWVKLVGTYWSWLKFTGVVSMTSCTLLTDELSANTLLAK